MSAIRVWIILIAMMLAGPTGFFACWWWMSKPPVVVYGVFEEDGVAVNGGQLDLIATKVDNAACLTSVARWLWRYDPTDLLPDTDVRKRKEWHEITSTPHSPPMVGKVSTYRLVVPLPANLEPDDHWHYLGQALDACSGPLGGGPRFSRDITIKITADDLSR